MSLGVSITTPQGTVSSAMSTTLGVILLILLGVPVLYYVVKAWVAIYDFFTSRVMA